MRKFVLLLLLLLFFLNKFYLNSFAGRATFLLPTIHRQSDIFVVLLIAQFKAFSYWLLVDQFNVIYRNIAKRLHCGVGVCKKSECFIVFMLLFNDTQLLRKSSFVCFYIRLIDLFEHILYLVNFLKMICSLYNMWKG